MTVHRPDLVTIRRIKELGLIQSRFSLVASESFRMGHARSGETNSEHDQ